MAEVLNAYWESATQHYGHSELGCLRVVIRVLRQMFGSTPAVDFGPNHLRLTPRFGAFPFSATHLSGIMELWAKGDQRD